MQWFGGRGLYDLLGVVHGLKGELLLFEVLEGVGVDLAHVDF